MNMHIRGDKENGMLLRQPLRECDAWLLTDAAQGFPGHVEDTIRRKLAQEEIYQPNARCDLSIPYPVILIKRDYEVQHYNSVVPDPLAIERRSTHLPTSPDHQHR